MNRDAQHFWKRMERLRKLRTSQQKPTEATRGGSPSGLEKELARRGEAMLRQIVVELWLRRAGTRARMKIDASSANTAH